MKKSRHPKGCCQGPCTNGLVAAWAEGGPTLETYDEASDLDLYWIARKPAPYSTPLERACDADDLVCGLCADHITYPLLKEAWNKMEEALGEDEDTPSDVEA